MNGQTWGRRGMELIDSPPLSTENYSETPSLPFTFQDFQEPQNLVVVVLFPPVSEQKSGRRRQSEGPHRAGRDAQCGVHTYSMSCCSNESSKGLSRRWGRARVLCWSSYESHGLGLQPWWHSPEDVPHYPPSALWNRSPWFQAWVKMTKMTTTLLVTANPVDYLLGVRQALL